MRSFFLRVTLALVIVFCVGALVPLAAQQTLSRADAEALAKDHTITWCNNIATICWGPCETAPTGITGGTSQAGGGFCQTFTVSGSLIDERSFNHRHDAWDYRPNGAGQGCSSCGTGGVTGISDGLMNASLMRFHRFRDMTQRSCFGPGVYSQYDVTFRVARKDDGTWQVVVFDPALMAPLILENIGGGVFKGPKWNLIQGMRFYAGAAGSGATVADPGQAASAVLTAFDGRKLVFDLIDPAGVLPAPWVHADIGSPGSYGTAGSTSTGTFSLSAGGTDIWSTSDSFGSIYQAVQGDVTITARVPTLATYRGLALDATDAWAKAGVMIRDGLDANAPAVHCFVTNGNGVNYQSRMTTGAAMVWDKNAPGVLPQWVRLVRQGDVITGSSSVDGVTWTTLIAKTVPMSSVVYVGMALSSHNTNQISDATFTNVSMTGTPVASASWPVPTVAPYYSGDRAGRLAQIIDRNGYALQVAYQTWTPAQLQQAPDLAWQIKTVTDAHGRQLAFQYGAQQVAGRWAVSSVGLPNGTSVSYGYTNGLLTSVAYPDGAASHFTYTPNANSNCTVVGYDDAGAETSHRRKEAYLTNQFSMSVSNRDIYQVTNQSANLIRILINGKGEVAYANYFPDSLTVNSYIGDGLVRQIKKSGSSTQVSHLETWSYASAAGLTGTLDAQTQTLQYASDDLYRQGTLSNSTDRTGVTKAYLSDADGFPTTVTYSDSTTEKYSYNAFKQVTRFEDRLKRVTKSTYDANGNLTQQEEGILFNGTTDVNQLEYAVTSKEYYPAGDAHQFLLKADVDANGNRTTYDYTPTPGTTLTHFITKIKTPADAGSGTIDAALMTYDNAGHKLTTKDAVGRTSTFFYDSRDRLVKTVFSDGSTEISVYGTSTNENLVVARKDRQGALTEFAYDTMGRVVTITVGAKTMSADGLTTTPIPAATIAAQSLQTQTSMTYLSGTTLPDTRTVNGEKTVFVYDYQQRQISQSKYVTSTTALTTTSLYVNNLLRQTTDPYGRKTYVVYRPSDARMVRQVQGLIPADGIADYTAATALARSASVSNPAYLITDYVLDAAGQQTDIVDPRGITSHFDYDSRARLTDQTEASSDATVSGHTHMIYDAQSNITDIQQPRYVDAADRNGYLKATTKKTYTKRNLLLTQTEALGLTDSVVKQQLFTYYNDGRLNTRTDERGNDWTTTWGACCGRMQGQEDPSVILPGATVATRPARIARHNDFGDLTHEGTVTDYATTNFPTLPTPTNVTNLTDAATVTEATSAYDVRHRLVARTVWLAPLGAVDANNPPIAGDNGVAANLGLTTRYRYDDNLSDVNGLSNPSDVDSVAPYLTGLGFGANADGQAVVVINPVGERQWMIQDGAGRTVRVIDGNGNATTTTYDVSENGLVKTTVTDALNHSTVQLADAAGRVRLARDAQNQPTTMSYDANGNRVSLRDPSNVGQDCVYDSRNRLMQCTDTKGAITKTVYDRNSNVVVAEDALTKKTNMIYDARNRKTSTTDRLPAETTFAYDAVNNLTTIRDAQLAETSYAYDARNLLVTETYPQGQNSASDVRTYLYDAAHRLLQRTDQTLAPTNYVYDFASRLTARQYSDGLNDGFTYDTASRLLTATSGRYATTVARDYTLNGERAGRLQSEGQTVGGVTRVVRYGYDADNRTTTVIYPDANVMVRTYTERNLLETVGFGPAGAPAAVASRLYDVSGRLSTTTLGNGLLESRLYNTDHTLSTLGVPGVTQFSYGYDANKRKTDEGHWYAADIQSFHYDPENRVTSWTRDGQDAQSWTLTTVGDWSATTRTGTTPYTQTRTHSPVHETTGVSINGAAVLPISYDAKGNLTSDGMTNQVYAWDPENRLKTATVNAANSTYVYDALGRRLAKTVAGVTTVFVHDGAQVISEFENGAWARSYTYGSYIDELLAMQTGPGTSNISGYTLCANEWESFALPTGSFDVAYGANGAFVFRNAQSGTINFNNATFGDPAPGASKKGYYRISGGQRFYAHANHLYSVAALTNQSGGVVERYRYDTYGNRTTLAPDGITTRATSSYNQQVGFTGYHLDQETGLYYARARMYSPTLGRFVGRDGRCRELIDIVKDNNFRMSMKRSADLLESHILYTQESIRMMRGRSSAVVQAWEADQVRDFNELAKIRTRLNENVLKNSGYIDGYDLYSAYFIPNTLDASGQSCIGNCMTDWAVGFLEVAIFVGCSAGCSGCTGLETLGASVPLCIVGCAFLAAGSGFAGCVQHCF